MIAIAVTRLGTVDVRIDACACLRLPPLSPAVRKDHILRTTSGGGSSESQPMGREVVFEVTRAWNGVTTKRLALTADESDCMFPFKIDQTYVVFAWKDAKGGPATSICTRTMESSKAAAVIAQLGPATSHVQ
jgi:hypothetical protein